MTHDAVCLSQLDEYFSRETYSFASGDNRGKPIANKEKKYVSLRVLDKNF